MKVIDLSKPIEFNRNDPFFMQVKIKHKPHRVAKFLVRLLGLPFRLFPKDFVGRGDMSRGGLLLRATADHCELEYASVIGATVHGPRPARLPKRR